MHVVRGGSVMDRKRLIEQAQDKKKKALEAQLFPKIRLMHRGLIRDFNRVFPLTSSVPNVDDLRQTLATTLESHYRDTRLAFEDQVAEDLDEQLDPAVNNIAALAFGVWVTRRSLFMAASIVATARNRFSRSISVARAAITQEQRAPATNRQALDMGRRMIEPYFKQQALTVSNTETQAAAEAIKDMTGQVASGNVPALLSGLPHPPVPIEPRGMKKTWLTQQDERVRSRHAATDGQVRDADKVFDVSGQSLMFPGDTSNGADLANVVNCRCSAFYERQ